MPNLDLLKNFAGIYDKELDWCKDHPEIPAFVFDVLNHLEVRAHCLQVSRALLNQIDLKALVANLSDDERMEIFSDYCKFCGSDTPRCPCENDE